MSTEVRMPRMGETVGLLGAVQAAGRLEAGHGIRCSVIDVRSLVPLDTTTIVSEVARAGRLFTVEENPRLRGWGAEIAAVRITTPHAPLPAADTLEDHMLPSVARITETVRKSLEDA